MNTAAAPLLTFDRPMTAGRAWIVPAGAAAMLLPGVPLAAALGAGVAVGLSGLNAAPARARRLAHALLQASVIGLGAGMSLLQVARTGAHGFLATLVSISATLLAARWLGRRLGVSANATLLIGAGTAICGGSAIAALSAALHPKAHDVTIAMATVFLLNAVALVIFPPLGHWAGLGPVAFGWWAALAIHDTSSVVGAGLAYGPVALAVATAVKLSRALWIVPLTLVLIRRRRGGAAGKVGFPWFLAGFAAMMVAAYLAPQFTPEFHLVAIGSQHLMAATLFLIGCGITRATLREVGVRPLALGLGLWAAVASVTLAAAAHGLFGR